MTSQGGVACNRNRDESTNAFQGSKIDLNIFPNLLIDADPMVELEMTKTQEASISVISGSSGSVMYALFHNKELSSGIHRFRLPSADLPPGIYYLVLQTKDRRIIKKMIKVRN